MFKVQVSVGGQWYSINKCLQYEKLFILRTIDKGFFCGVTKEKHIDDVRVIES